MISPGVRASIAGEAAAAGSSANGPSNIVWQNATTGQRVIWHMSGTQWNCCDAQNELLTIPTEWSIVASADFTGDGNADLLWQRRSTGDQVVWHMDGTEWRGAQTPLLKVHPDWWIVGAADFSGDGKPDILWQNRKEGRQVIWHMDGTEWRGSQNELMAVSPEWWVVGVGNFTGDNRPDILWQNQSVGRQVIWHMNGTTWGGAQNELMQVAPEWRIVAAADFTGDGGADILWQNRGQGRQVIWHMNGTEWQGSQNELMQVPSEWHIATTMAAPAAGPTGFLQQPYAGEYFNPNVMDHDPSTTGDVMPWWGEPGNWGYQNHNGFDINMPIGTPILAAADGQVTYSGFDWGCSTSRIITIEHITPSGERYRSLYAHLSRQDVQAGQRVTAGEQIALSGDTGQGICSTGPHLHFGVYRVTTSGQRLVDPYGWSGSMTDPWIAAPNGAESTYLWKRGRAPELLWRHVLPLNPEGSTSQIPIAITLVQWAGADDARNPNNEFVEIRIDPRYAGARWDLTGWTLRNNRGETFTFPSGMALTEAAPAVRVYSGSGASGAGVLYWGRSSGAWLNGPAECTQLQSNGFRNGVASGYRYAHSVSFWMKESGRRYLSWWYGSESRCFTESSATTQVQSLSPVRDRVFLPRQDGRIF